jgi:hypothetical protein
MIDIFYMSLSKNEEKKRVHKHVGSLVMHNVASLYPKIVILSLFA